MKNRKTTNKIVKYAAIALITILNLLVLLMWLGQLSFGHGLGDLSFLGFYTLLALLGYIIVIVNKNKFVNIILIVVFIIANFLFIEKATIGRGPEQKWNGHLFVLAQRQNSPLFLSVNNFFATI